MSCSYLRSDKSYECFLQKKCKQTHSVSFCTALILLCWNASFTSRNVQTLRDSRSPPCQFWRQKLISCPKSLAKSTHKHKSKLIQLKSIFHKMVDGCCWLVRTRGWNNIFLTPCRHLSCADRLEFSSWWQGQTILLVVFARPRAQSDRWGQGCPLGTLKHVELNS